MTFPRPVPICSSCGTAVLLDVEGSRVCKLCWEQKHRAPRTYRAGVDVTNET